MKKLLIVCTILFFSFGLLGCDKPAPTVSQDEVNTTMDETEEAINSSTDTDENAN